jgi:hypothetical protein
LIPWPDWQLPETEEGKRLRRAIGKTRLQPDVLVESRKWLLVVECEKSHFSYDLLQMRDQYAAARLLFRSQQALPVYHLLISEGAPVGFRRDIRQALRGLGDLCSELGLSADDLMSRFLWIGWRTVARILGHSAVRKAGVCNYLEEALALLEDEELKPLPNVLASLEAVSSHEDAVRDAAEALASRGRVNRGLLGSVARFTSWVDAPDNRRLLDGMRRTRVLDAARTSSV